MKTLYFFLLLELFFSFGSSLSLATGLGDITVLSHLGEPFKADVALIGNDPQVSSSCSVANLLSGDSNDLMSAKTLVTPDNPHIMHISTTHPLSEPACYLRLTIDCKDIAERRTYALLLDLPPSITSSIAPPNVPVTVSMSAPEHATTASSTSTHHSSLRHSNKHAVHPTPRHSVSDAKMSRRAGSDHSVHAGHKTTSDWLSVSEEPPVAQNGLRLHVSTEIDPALIAQAAQNLVQLHSAKAHLQQLLQAPSVPPSTDVMDELKLEQAQVLSLKRQLKQLKQPRPSPFVTGTWTQMLPSLLAAAEFLALIFLWIRHNKQQKPAEWWEEYSATAHNPTAEPPTAASHSPKTDTTAVATAVATPVASFVATTAPLPSIPEPETLTTTHPRTTVMHQQTVHSTPYPIGLEHPLYPSIPNDGDNIEVQELSDITQEAEFWISVNNPDKAIELLESQTSLDTQESPAPWLYLFDLYRSTRQAEKYEALKNQISRHFNVNVPDYGDDATLLQTRHIEDYPHLIKKIAALWKQPGIIAYLRELLLADKTREKRVGFDLSVYQDIIMLIGVAQEIERNGWLNTPGISAPVDDLDLNIDDLHDVFRVI